MLFSAKNYFSIKKNENFKIQSLTTKTVEYPELREVDKHGEGVQSNKRGRPIRIKLGEFGRKYVLENWTWEKATEEIEKNFLSVIKNE